MSKDRGTFIEFEIVPTLDEIEDQLGSLKEKAAKVLKKALNDTAKWTGRELAKEAQDFYRVKTVKFAKEFKISRATNSKLTATLVAMGYPMSSSKFKISPTGPHPSAKGSPSAKVAILQKESPREVVGRGRQKAFVTTFGSGHIAVVQRQPGQTYTSKGWKNRKSKWKKYRKRTGHLDNTRIREFYGPSAPKMLEMAGVTKEYLGTYEPKIMEHLKEAVRKHINTEIHFASQGRR